MLTCVRGQLLVALRAAREVEKEHEKAQAEIRQQEERLATIMPNLTMAELQALHGEVEMMGAPPSAGLTAR